MPIDYESVLEAAYEAILGPGDNAVDVGAHQGRHTIPMVRRVLPGGRVFAFEPLPSCQSSLRKNLKAALGNGAGSVTVHACALSDQEGTGEFVVAKDALAYSGLRERVYDTPTALERIEVTIRKLDAVLPELPSLRYIKVDAEGGDLHILRGAEKCLRRYRPVVSLEFGLNSARGYGVAPSDVTDFFGTVGYRLMDINGRDVTAPDRFARSAQVQDVWDYLAIPSEAGELHERILSAIQARREALGAEKPQELFRSELSFSGHVSREGGGRLQVRVRNASRATWPLAGGKGAIRLGIIWFAAGRTDKRLGEHRAELPLPMAPGSEAEVLLPLEPIGYDQQRLPPGRYEVWVALVQEEVAWFYDRGDGLLRLPVTVGD